MALLEVEGLKFKYADENLYNNVSFRILPKEHIVLVGDNGCGIPKEKVKHLFNGYIENKSIPADGSRNNMGIGLSVCSTIIKAHGGDITVKNNNGVGTVFIFSLNMEDDDNEQ